MGEMRLLSLLLVTGAATMMWTATIMLKGTMVLPALGVRFSRQR